MSNRPKGYGLTAEVSAKMNAKYVNENEIEARQWMEQILGEPIAPGLDPNEACGPRDFARHLKDGTYLCRLANAIMGENTIKFNTSKMAFKQMENIGKFITACENYGMVKTDCFQTVDLYEGQNPWNVVCTLYALGRKAQKNGYTKAILGPKEATENKREFSEEQLRASEGMISKQAGTNQLASQKGMTFGKGRFIADMKIDKQDKGSEGIIGLQAGTNQMASQKGMAFGKGRFITDIKVDRADRESDGIIGLQAGTNQGASQAGQSFGARRQIAESNLEQGTKEGQGIIGLQYGTNEGANQSGLNMGKPRSIVD